MIDLEKLKEVGLFAKAFKENKNNMRPDEPMKIEAYGHFLYKALSNWDAMIKEIETLREAKKEALCLTKNYKELAEVYNYPESFNEADRFLEKYGSEND